MTREQASKIIRYTFLNADGHMDSLDFDYGDGNGIVKALCMAVSALEESDANLNELPSGVDIAAEKWTEENVSSCDYIGAAVAQKAFIAGVQWLAEQGITARDIKLRDGAYPGNPSIPAVKDYGFFLDDGDFKVGDKVIVQFRKQK